ncbi:MAG: MarR family winged helix-turn-helix transcriptional regulator [Chloroflexia bacterium]
MRHKVIIMYDKGEAAGGEGSTNSSRQAALEEAASVVSTVAPRFFKLVKARMARDLDLADDIRDMGDSQIWVLHALSKGRHQNSELARNYNVTDPTMSRIIDALVRKGYVERHPDLDDRRCVLLEITERGTGLASQIGEHFHRAVVQFLSPLTEEQLNDVLKAYRHLGSLLPETSQDMERELHSLERDIRGGRERPADHHRERGFRGRRRAHNSYGARI